jgi:hypothetical protein
MSPVNRGLARIARRADQKSDEHLRQTFVDSGITAALDMPDHQVLFGRRGTGKTHALRYLQGQREAAGDVAVYLDLRVVGSPEGLFGGEPLAATERTGRLLVDLLSQLHDELLTRVIDDDDLLANNALLHGLDDLVRGITTVRVDVRSIETENTSSDTASSNSGVGLTIGASPSLQLRSDDGTTSQFATRRRETADGPERVRINFTDVAQALRRIGTQLGERRLWLFLDEWSSVPQAIQPLLGEFLVRCVLPLRTVTVKIAAIEQQTTFRSELGDGQMVGIELGADVTANVNLDDFMVFEQSEDRSRNFFRDLLTAHLLSDADARDAVESPGGIIAHGFRDRRAFDELVRAAEGVPRDAINIASKAALSAADKKISVDDVRGASQAWFTSDKEAALRSHDDASSLLRWIIDEVIRGKQARGFLVNQRQSQDGLLLALFDARVLHVVRRGYSAQDVPGERFDVWVIDYGAYVDLISTKYAPKGVLLVGPEDNPEWVEVPPHDLRAIRRAILDLERFRGSGEQLTLS